MANNTITFRKKGKQTQGLSCPVLIPIIDGNGNKILNDRKQPICEEIWVKKDGERLNKEQFLFKKKEGIIEYRDLFSIGSDGKAVHTFREGQREYEIAKLFCYHPLVSFKDNKGKEQNYNLSQGAIPIYEVVDLNMQNTNFLKAFEIKLKLLNYINSLTDSDLISMRYAFNIMDFSLSELETRVEMIKRVEQNYLLYFELLNRKIEDVEFNMIVGKALEMKLFVIEDEVYKFNDMVIGSSPDNVRVKFDNDPSFKEAVYSNIRVSYPEMFANDGSLIVKPIDGAGDFPSEEIYVGEGMADSKEDTSSGVKINRQIVKPKTK